ncbi:MAG: LysR family transcriptional regulator [Solirubrobacteraceae bacterium]
MSITLTQLRSFLAVVRAGSVTEAADALFVTQPSISAAVTALSRELDTALLERVGRGVQTTAAGAAFAPFAADVIGLLDAGARAALEAAEATQRALRIAAVTTAAESFVPGLMHRFSIAHPDVGLMLSVGNRQRVLELVAAHEADVAFGGSPPETGRIEAHAFMTNELVLVCAPDAPLARREQVSVGELVGCTWLLREPGSGTRTVNEVFLAEHGLASQTLTVGSNGAIKQAARAGLGVSFVSRCAVEAELQGGLLETIDIEAAPVARRWHVMQSSIGPRRAIVEDFVGFVRSGEAAARTPRHSTTAAKSSGI